VPRPEVKLPAHRRAALTSAALCAAGLAFCPAAAAEAAPCVAHVTTGDLTNGFDIKAMNASISYTVVAADLTSAQGGPQAGQVIDASHAGHIEMIYKFMQNSEATVTLKSSKDGKDFTIHFLVNPLRATHIRVEGQEPEARGGRLPDGTHWLAPGVVSQPEIDLGI
jgi:hypothetical protein